jgi:hypothetical protein
MARVQTCDCTNLCNWQVLSLEEGYGDYPTLLDSNFPYSLQTTLFLGRPNVCKKSNSSKKIASDDWVVVWDIIDFKMFWELIKCTSSYLTSDSATLSSRTCRRKLHIKTQWIPSQNWQHILQFPPDIVRRPDTVSPWKSSQIAQILPPPELSFSQLVYEKIRPWDPNPRFILRSSLCCRSAKEELRNRLTLTITTTPSS